MLRTYESIINEIIVLCCVECFVEYIYITIQKRESLIKIEIQLI
jgi:hypothetical protein